MRIAPPIDRIIRGFEFPKIIGIGPINNTPPVSIFLSEVPLNEEKTVPIKISSMPIITTMNPSTTNLSKIIIQSYLNSS
mgnify:CR=1 FL=1